MDISVLILFFNRAEHLRNLFEVVREAQPARLFLYQDGARDGRDLPGVEECRKVVERIDWPCEVHRLYQKKNYGCDPSNYMAQQWAFSQTERCVVFEDDDIPSLSFFRFCEEMLERYADDDRVGMIQGFNPEEKTPDTGGADYFFSTNFSIWGWASWRRVVSKWDEKYSWLDDDTAVSRLEQIVRERSLRKDLLPMARAHRESGKAYYETIFQAHLLLNSQLAVVPQVNMVSNKGVTDDSTHFAGSVRTLPRGYRRIFTMGRHELHFPLHHPQHVTDHVAYRKRVYRIMAWNHPWIKAVRSIEELATNLRHGQWRRITQAVTNRLDIIFRGRKFH